MALLSTLKALPLAYNKDMQEDKEGLFDTVDTLNATLAAFAGMVETMTINRERTRRAAEAGVYSGILATDLADYLVAKGLPFREAHGATKSLVVYAAEKSTALNELSLEENRRFSSLFEEDVFRHYRGIVPSGSGQPWGHSAREGERSAIAGPRGTEVLTCLNHPR